jgi:DNA replication licensing factor MCM6
VGKLVGFKGTITRTSEVRPELIMGCFRCQECDHVIRDVEQQFQFTEPTSCPTDGCNNKSRWTLDSETSRFCDWQRVRVVRVWACVALIRMCGVSDAWT